jgi:hypothetical protein
MSLIAPDLTQRPPRSPRTRLGGYVILPRILDKCRASLADKNGEYCYDCPTDQHFFEFAGIEASALQAQVATGKSDGEILDWITANSKTKPTPSGIMAWSRYQELRAPCDLEGREYFQEEHRRLAPHRTDIVTWFDYLDLDDFVFFGGKP